MTANNSRLVRTLNRLHRICHAGARGFEVVAANVSNRGLKVLLKTYVQQRAQFAGELAEEIHRLGGEVSKRRSIRGIIHRGRIDIKATLTIGPQNVENVVLNEAILGETAAVRTYKNALRKEMPAETRAIVERQAEEIQAVSDQVDLLRGQSGRRLVVRLFDSEAIQAEAIAALESAGFSADAVETVDLDQMTSAYEGSIQATTIDETVISGALGGAIFGSIFGAVAGVGVLLFPGLQTMMQVGAQSAWSLVALAGTFTGAFFGVILGFLVGLGIAEEDRYLYDDSLKHGNKLIMLETDSDRAAEAARIMQRVNAAAKQPTEPMRA